MKTRKPKEECPKRLIDTSKRANRKCLKCDRMFKSEGPWNRICGNCRQVIANYPTLVTEKHVVFNKGHYWE